LVEVEHILDNKVHRKYGYGLVGDFSSREIAPHDFLPVQVDDRAIIPQEIEVKLGEFPWLVNGKSVPEVGGDVLVAGVWAIADNSSFVSIAITELGGALTPTAVVVGRFTPGCTLVGSVVQIFPGRSGVNKGDGRSSGLVDEGG